jgi:cysteine desulfurase / selenocysteine lyase
MIDVVKIRKEYQLLNKKDPVIYFDNSATMLKPRCVIDAIDNYYSQCSANPHGEDYSLGIEAQKEYEGARQIVANFMGADAKELVFTSGATDALNAVATILGYQLKKGDEVLITKAEHASNILPWFRLQRDLGIKVSYIELDHGVCTLENVKKAITPKTKVISIAQVTNVLAYVIDVKSICEYAHKFGIICVIDGAQSSPHLKVNVHDLGCDYFALAGHKLGGPTGIGALYIRAGLEESAEPHNLGGGMNARFDKSGKYSYVKVPYRFEAGSQNVDGAIGLASAVQFLESIGLDNIHKYEVELKQYAVKKLKAEVPGIIIYNEGAESGVITFNLKGIFAQDVATHFNKYGICVRAGLHCAKLLPEVLNTPVTVRASLAFYNTKEEVDKFVAVAKKGDEFLDVFF